MGQTARVRNKKKEVKDILVQSNVLTKNQLLEIQKKGYGKNSDKMLSFLLDRGDVSEKDVLNVLSEQYNCQIINIEDFDISPDLIKLVPYKFCSNYSVIPISRIGDTIVVACFNPSNVFVKEQLVFLTGCKIEFVLAARKSISMTIESLYEQNEEEMHKLFTEIEETNLNFQKKHKTKDEEADKANVEVLNKNDPEPIIRCVNRIINCAIRRGSSDIHIESYEKKCRIRYRIDGQLREIFHPPKNIIPYIISRFKVMSKLDISEKRKPQDGRLKVSLDGGKEIDFRVSVAPTVGGEKIVLRVLDSSGLLVDVKSLGMTDSEKNLFSEALKSPQGMILVCGPTGSGKTTTIYSGLKLLNTEDLNISTAEDPVEYKIEGLNQVHILPKIGLTFTSALRSFLRQDPDVMFVGEIRDLDAAETAFKAASTGHLVVSTIHTNDTPSVITRLMDMGVPDYSIADNVTLVVGQRLIRKICTRCKTSDRVSRSSLEILGLTKKQIEMAAEKIKKGKGCRSCDGIGYKGRIAVFEMLKITDNIRNSIFDKVPSVELKKHAIKSGELRTVRQNGISKLMEGVTSYEEVLYGTMGDYR